jgi:hypothetical protein
MINRTSKLYLEAYFTYLDFIESKKTTTYSSGLVLHRHHIIPTFLDEKAEFKNKTVMLSVEDHVKAHELLSKCFDEGSYEELGNLRALKLLTKNSIPYKEQLSRVYDSQRGDNNPAKLPNNRKKITQGLLKYYEEHVNPKKNRSYSEIYGDKAEEERLKRKKCTRSPEEYAASGKKVSEKLKGRIPHNAKAVVFQGVSYNSMSEAIRMVGKTRQYIKKQL